VVNHPAGKDITEEGGGAAGFHLIRSGRPRSPCTARAARSSAPVTTSVRSR
jgi:hypothetical protein